MAGEWIIKQINKRGGNRNDYADLTFGTVLSTTPLKVQLSNKITLTEPFLIKGKYVTEHVERMTIDGVEKEVTVHDSLNNGDKVAMFRLDGGQTFYILEKI